MPDWGTGSDEALQAGVARETYEPPPPQTWDWATKVSLQPLGGAQHQTRGDLKPAEREERPPLFVRYTTISPLPGGRTRRSYRPDTNYTPGGQRHRRTRKFVAPL